jgi:ribosome-associated heat shock protein Hsp15
VKHRSQAAELVEQGHIRINRIPTRKPAHPVKPTDVLTIALNSTVLVIEVLGEAKKRGPASEARLLYKDLAPRSTHNNHDENLGA